MRRWILIPVVVLTVVIAAVYGSCAVGLFLLKWINPATTAVQIERRIDAIAHGRAYSKRYNFVPLPRISPELQHAVIAAEDERFQEHGGIDWIELKKVIEKDVQRGRLGRGGSTITQQLVKNLYLSTNRSLFRKGAEFVLVPLAETILGKNRILELYLNVIEWGPGVYGAEAASQSYYRIAASQVNRDHAARLAACIPAPLKRRPSQMGGYADVILVRMRQMGW